MSKPFDVPTLMAKVEQLLMASDKIARNMRLDRLTEAPEEKTESASDRQLAAVTNVIENNLSNPDLNVDFVCKALDLQSKALYRLLKKYVGVSPVDYIRQMRLRKAAMLLEQKKFFGERGYVYGRLQLSLLLRQMLLRLVRMPSRAVSSALSSKQLKFCSKQLKLFRTINYLSQSIKPI